MRYVIQESIHWNDNDEDEGDKGDEDEGSDDDDEGMNLGFGLQRMSLWDALVEELGRLRCGRA